MTRSSLLLLTITSMLAGCAVDAAPGTTGTDPVGDKADRWNRTNDPVRFHDDFEYLLDQLPQSGRAAQQVWPETYWPTYEDSINRRYAAPADLVARTVDDLSPVEKYDLAFNNWEMPEGFLNLRPFRPGRDCQSAWDASYYTSLGPLARYVAQNLGNEENRNGVDDDGDGQVDECDDYDGIQTWTGLCHAWYSSAIAEEGPGGSVQYNGITFYPSDMKALLMIAYNSTGSTLLGGRCDSMTVQRDATGRIINDECRDLNAGSFHVALGNMIGLRQQAIGEDRTYDLQVWNQPVLAYSVDSSSEISVEQAHQLLNTSGDTYRYNDDAVRLYDVTTTITWLTESSASMSVPDASAFERTSTYSYILEVDGDGNIIGGEWYGASITDHPDFFTKVNRRSASSTSQLDLQAVRDLVAMSRQ